MTQEAFKADLGSAVHLQDRSCTVARPVLHLSPAHWSYQFCTPVLHASPALLTCTLVTPTPHTSPAYQSHLQDQSCNQQVLTACLSRVDFLGHLAEGYGA